MFEEAFPGSQFGKRCFVLESSCPMSTFRQECRSFSSNSLKKRPKEYLPRKNLKRRDFVEKKH